LNRALAILEKLVAEYPNLVAYQQTLGRARYELSEYYSLCPDRSCRDPQRAREMALLAVGQSNGEAGDWKILALAEYRCENWGAAIEAARKGIEIRRNGYAYDWLILALAHARRGEIEQARAWFAKLGPDFDRTKVGDTPFSLYQEAEALLGVNRSPVKAQEQPTPEPKTVPE